MTANTFIIDEYKWQGHKQLLLEKLRGEDASGYRVTIVLRCPTLAAAKEAYLRDIPETRQEYHSGIIEDYAAKYGIKTTQEKPAHVQLKLGEPKKGKQNAKSKQKAD